MFGKKNVIKVFYFEGLVGFSQDSTCLIEVNNDSITITSKKPKVTASLSFEQLKSVDILLEKNFYLQYLHVKKDPIKFLIKTFYVFKYVSSSNEEKYFVVYGFNFKVTRQIQKLIKQLHEKTPAEYSL